MAQIPSRPTADLTQEERAALVDYWAQKPRHCRHYSYDRSNLSMVTRGPKCAAGIDLSAPGASKCCWPEPRGTCSKREGYTQEERRAKAEEQVAGLERTAKALTLIPPRTSGAVLGPTSGQLDCPNCSGRITWARARSNQHLHAACSTPGCFAIME